MSLYLVLYIATLVVHVVLASYVLVGAGWLAITAALARKDDADAATFRDWLPFAIGAAITAGVAPLLFVQILYQERFYTANLLLQYRWLAVIPALIAGFYGAYLNKAERTQRWHPRWRAAIAAATALCFVFVAWSWTENHLLSLRPDRWPAMYGAGQMTHYEPALPPRLLLWLGLAGPAAATLIVWQVDDVASLRRLRALALGGLAVAAAAAFWLYTTLSPAADHALFSGPGGALAVAVVATEIALAVLWLRLPSSRLLRVAASLALLAAVILGALLRERLRLPFLAAARPRVLAAGGLPLFLFFLALNTSLIVWCVRSALRHLKVRGT
jgi:hypothetical protein